MQPDFPRRPSACPIFPARFARRFLAFPRNLLKIPQKISRRASRAGFSKVWYTTFGGLWWIRGSHAPRDLLLKSESNKIYYQKNKDRLAEKWKNDEARKAYLREYYKKNKEIILERAREWNKRNKEEIRKHDKIKHTRDENTHVKSIELIKRTRQRYEFR